MKTNKHNKTDSSGPSGTVDDAIVTAEVAGSKSARFGLAIDSIGRSTPTHMIPFYVRRALAMNWTPGFAFPMYSEPQDNIPTATTYGWAAPASVAEALTVTTGEAEDFGSGLLTFTDNRFLNYTDGPMYSPTLDRLSFWRYDSAAVEFDEHYAFEAQVVAIDAMSHLFVESFDFHFHYLADLDEEYHRLRSEGPLGVFDDSSETPAWYNMYHYWRDRLEVTYLQGANPRITLPTGLLNANWTIQDVLDEILELMITADGNFRPDIFVSIKGAEKAKSGASLGKIEDAAYADNDGNPRFYMPKWDTTRTYSEGNVAVADTNIQVAGIAAQASAWTNGVLLNYADNLVASYTLGGVHVNADARSMTPVHEWADSLTPARTPLWRPGPMYANFDLEHTDMDTYLSDLPDETGLLGGTHAYWRGYQLNLVDLVVAMRQMGRELEPEVADGFLPAFGLLASPLLLTGAPRGLSARMHDDLFNLYTSNFTYRDNPVRTYSAGHLGPLDQVVAPGDVTLGDVNVSSFTGTVPTTLRERYWTPELLTGSGQIGQILAHFMPGAIFEGSLFGNVRLSGAGNNPQQVAESLATHVSPSLISRAFGTNNSMLTKVEKPVVLPAGVTSPDASYASGLGAGSKQLISELLFSVFGGSPTFGLGHNGFIDWRPSPGAVGDEAFDQPTGYPMGRLEAASATPTTYVTTSFDNPTGGALFSTASRGMAVSLLNNGVSESVSTYSSAGLESVLDAPTGRDDEYSNILGKLNGAMVPSGDVGAYSGFTNWVIGAGGLDFVGSTSSQTVLSTTVGTQSVDAASGWGMFTALEADPTSHREPHVGTPLAAENKIDISVVPTSVVFSTLTETLTVPIVIAPTPEVYGGTSLINSADAQVVSTGASNVALLGGGGSRLGIPFLTAAGVKQTYTDHANAGNMYTGIPNVSIHDVVLSALMQSIGSSSEDVEALLESSAGGGLAVTVSGDVYEHGNVSLSYTRSLNFEHEFQLDWGVEHGTFPLSASADRSQFAGPARKLTSTAEIVSRSELSYVSSSSNVMPGTLAYSGGWTGWELPANVGAFSRNYQLVAVLDTMVDTPGGEWSAHNWEATDDVLGIDELERLYDPTDPIGYPEGVGMHVLAGEPGVTPSLWQVADPSWVTASGNVDWKAGSRLWPDAGGFIANAGAEIGHTLSGAGPAYWFLNSNNLTTQEALQPFFSLRNTANNPSGHTASTAMVMAGSSADSVTYVIPDDPNTRMIYRPYRRLVDAAVSRELRQLFMPTHEQVSVEGGPLGLPVYGQPVHFRLAQLVYDANLPDQYILEKATTKTRMVDPSNRGMLTFSRIPLLDENTQRHVLTDVVNDLNDTNYTRGVTHTAGPSGQVYTIANIRDIQLGRQYQRW